MDALTRAPDAADRSYAAATKAVASRASRSLASAPGGVYSQPASLSKAAEQYKHNCGWTYSCVKAIAQKLAEREVFVGRPASKPRGKKGIDDLEPLESHPILDLLADPCPLLTRWSLLYMTVANLELTGRAHWWLTQEKGKAELWPLPSSWCEPKDPFRGSWIVKPKNSSGEGFEVPGDDMVYFALPDPSDPFGCLSPLQSQSTAVATDEEIQVAQFRAFKNGIFPGVMIRAGKLPNMLGTGEGVRPVLTEDQRRELVEGIKKFYRGGVNYNEPFIVDGLIESIERFSLTPAELDVLNSGEVTKSRIFQALGVSPFSLGQIQDGNRAQALVAEVTFAQNVLNPLATLLSESMTAWVAPRFAANGERLVIWIDPIVPRDIEVELKTWELALRFGCAERNEYRVRMMNLPKNPQFAGQPDLFNQMARNALSRPAADEVGTRQAEPGSTATWEFDRWQQHAAARDGNGKGH